MIYEYNTIKGTSTGEYKEKGSKFIAYAYPVDSEDTVKELLDQLRKEHPKSRHVCYAFSIGIQQPIERANDDGEPSSTAGKPILGQIHSFQLNNVLIAVVRYFGGTLLGASGLITAYRAAAEDSLQHNKVVSRSVKALYQIEMGYGPFHEVMSYLKGQEITFIEQEMEAACRLLIAIEAKQREGFEQNMLNFNDVKCTLTGYE